MLLAGCGSANLGTKPTPSPGAKPAVKKELPWWLTVPGGRMKTTLFYGPWQCRQQFMNECQMKCAQEGYPLMGCNSGQSPWNTVGPDLPYTDD